ncbi:hypothetical protein TIFTF001_006826 [Ficus carica]|uniref:Bifunctional inhibitor/plant lipid transfer protein/seed storage helical domain-containing protein n=1 Tax=Ficus carica TaxID=3494 RepID=A0AA87ZI51_FICCA|nr:hypothetical protein TIFTF001_006826 [Ficus carica]
MATQSKKLVLVALAVMALAILGTKGETTFSLCRMTKEGFKSCQPSVDVTSPEQQPSEACCAAISGADFQCLCNFKNSTFLKFYRVDPSLAMTLPRRCNLDGPSFHCQ